MQRLMYSVSLFSPSASRLLQHVGEMEVVNHETGERAVVTFKEGSSWGGSSSRNKVEGKLYDANGSVHTEVSNATVR